MGPSGTTDAEAEDMQKVIFGSRRRSRLRSSVAEMTFKDKIVGGRDWRFYTSDAAADLPSVALVSRGML